MYKELLKQTATALIMAAFILTGCEDNPMKVSGVTLDKATLELEAGGSATLVAAVAPDDAENKAVTWSSNDNAVATVDQSGNVKAVAAGTATITVITADGGFMASSTVTVTTGTLPDTHIHEWGEWVVTKEPTCETDGEEVRTCTHDPSHTEKRDIPATGHEWGEWVVTKEVTCETDGEEVRTCTLDPSHTEKRTIPAIGHKWIDWVVIKEPVGTTAGVLTKTCEYCGHKETDDFYTGYSFSSNNVVYVNTSSDIYSWQPDEANFDIEALKALGYKSVDVKIDFSIRSDGFQGSECWVKVYKGRTTTQSNTNMWGEGEQYNMGAVLPWESPPWLNRSLTINVPLDNYDNEFSIHFVRSGIFNFIVGARTVNVTAKK